MDDFFTQSCTRNVTRSKYEKQNLETYFWWQRLFKIMEDEIKIPQYQKLTVIREIFPKKILKKILKVLTFVIKDAESEEYSVSMYSSKRASDSEITVPGYEDDKLENAEIAHTEDYTLGENSEFEGRIIENISFIGRVELPQYSEMIRIIALKKKVVGPNNPYKRFFNRNPERVAIWRELPPLKLEEMNLSQKSVAVTEAIAVDFVNWIVRLGGKNTSTLSVEHVVKMFEIGFNVHAATSLEALTKELPSLTKSLSVSMKIPEKFWWGKLQGELSKDITAFKETKKWRAFGTTLPKNIRYIPPKTDETVKWLQIKAPEDIVTMKNVWDGITHLRSTRAYCKWLIEHPHLAAPPYLKDLGMLNPEYYLQPHYSVETMEGTYTAEDSHALLFGLKRK